MSGGPQPIPPTQTYAARTRSTHFGGACRYVPPTDVVRMPYRGGRRIDDAPPRPQQPLCDQVIFREGAGLREATHTCEGTDPIRRIRVRHRKCHWRTVASGAELK